MRGKVDVGEANELLRERGHDDLRFLDNGAIGRRMEGIEGPTHAYHLVPGGASKAKGVGIPPARPRLRARASASRSATRSRTSRPPTPSVASSASPTAPSATRRCARRSPRFPNATVTEGGDGRRLLRGGGLDPRDGAEAAPTKHQMSRWLRITRPSAEEEYLQIMFWLEEAGLPITGANIARAMQLSPPTVHEMIGRLERDGYVSRGDDKSLRFTDRRPRPRAGDRPPPPADRALPHRRPRHPLGRGPRGGRAARARDVAGARGADAGRDRRRHDLPARPPDRRGRARARARCSPTSSPAPRSTCCGSRTRPRSCCTT